MSRRTHTTPTDESIDDRQHAAPERNRYFHGKLMTARDMAAEQRYHRGSLTRHARSVTGYGVVEGLDGSVERVEGGMAVTVSPGYAIDCAGRPVVVPRQTTVEVPNEEIPGGDRLELRLEYDECVTETVPIPGSEDACERECAYNRIVETFDLEIDRYDPEERPVKPIPPVELPHGGVSEPPVEDDLVTELSEELREALRDAEEVREAEGAAREATEEAREAEEAAREAGADAGRDVDDAVRPEVIGERLRKPDVELAEHVDLEQRRSRFLLQSSPEPTPKADPLLEPELDVVNRRREAAIEAGDTSDAERLLQLRRDIEAGRTSLVPAARIGDALRTGSASGGSGSGGSTGSDALAGDEVAGEEVAGERSAEKASGEGSPAEHAAGSRSAGDRTWIARSWDGVEDRPVGCGTEAAGTIPLGAFDRPTEGAVTVDPASRPRVYTNDMLYSGLAHHVTDFGNPHDVVASLQGLTGGVELDSADDSVEFGVDPEAGTVDLSVVDAGGGGGANGGGGDEVLRIQAMATGVDAFGEVASDFDVDEADELADVLRNAVEADEIARHADRYLEFVYGGGAADVLELYHAIGNALEDHVGGRERYENAVDVLSESGSEEDSRGVAVAQLLVADAARRLTGRTVDLTRFFPNPDPARPLTIDGVIFDAPEGFQLLHEEWYELLEEAEAEAEKAAEDADDDGDEAEPFKPVLREGRIDLDESIRRMGTVSAATGAETERDPTSETDAVELTDVETRRMEGHGTEGTKEESDEGEREHAEREAREDSERTMRTVELDATVLEDAKPSRAAFFGPAVIDEPDLGERVIDVIDEVVPIRRTPRAYLDFSELYVDVPETAYVEGDLGVGKYPVEVLALDRSGNLVDDDEVEADQGPFDPRFGRRTFTVAGEEIDRLRLSVEQGTGELTELRIR